MDEATINAALVLISEKVRFWSDPQRGIGGEVLPARCLAPDENLRLSLIEIDQICKGLLKK